MNSTKNCLVIVNVFFLVLSLVLLGVGAFIQISLNGKYNMLSGHLTTPAAILVTLGVLLSLASLLALIGVYTRRNGLLSAYICILVILIIVELSLGIIGFVAKYHVFKLVTKSMRSSEAKYTSNPFVNSTWDSVQRELRCCGVDDHSEWFPYLNSSLPDSCCAFYTVGCGSVAPITGNYYRTDCATAISEWAHAHEIPIAVFFSLILIFQLLSLLCLKLYLEILCHYNSECRYDHLENN